MTSITTISEFDTWLGRRGSCHARPVVTLNGAPGAVPPHLVRELAHYLRNTDDGEPEDWQPFAPEDLRRLVSQMPGNPGPHSLHLAALSLVKKIVKRGGAVLALPGACRANRDAPEAFHVWLQCSREYRIQRLSQWHGCDHAAGTRAVHEEEESRDQLMDSIFGPRREPCMEFCHLTLNLDHLGDCPMVQIIGDTVLEWSASRSRASECRNACASCSNRKDHTREASIPSLAS